MTQIALPGIWSLRQLVTECAWGRNLREYRPGTDVRLTGTTLMLLVAGIASA